MNGRHVGTTANVSVIETRKGSAFSEMVVNDFENGLVRAGFDRRHRAGWSSFWDAFGRGSGRVGLVSRTRETGRPAAVVGMMGLAERQLYPYIFSQRLVPFIWDCWPDREDDWRRFFSRHQFSKVALTSQDAARYWSREFPDLDVVWAAEAIDHRSYRPGAPLADRPSVLLEVGRRYQLAHQTAERTLAGLGAASGHQYDRRTTAEPFLPTRADLISALRLNRALLCHPGSISDPQGRTGGWETMTHRYLEAVATKTLVLGNVPREMTELFGFEPGVTTDNQELPEALEVLYRDPASFQPLVDRAHARLLEVATWDVRGAQLKRFVEGNANGSSFRA